MGVFPLDNGYCLSSAFAGLWLRNFSRSTAQEYNTEKTASTAESTTRCSIWIRAVLLHLPGHSANSMAFQQLTELGSRIVNRIPQAWGQSKYP